LIAREKSSADVHRDEVGALPKRRCVLVLLTFIGGFPFCGKFDSRLPAEQAEVIRLVLNNARWERVAPLLPGKAGDPGRTAADNRLFFEAVVWIARAVRFRFSQSLARRRQRLSQAIVRSTIQRFGRTTKPLARSEGLTISMSSWGRILHS
jgi:hypothetical protein